MDSILIAMILAVLIPIYEIGKDENIWQKILAFTSIATKTTIIMLVIAFWRDDWSIGLIAVIIMSAGDAGLVLMANVIRSMNESERQ